MCYHTSPAVDIGFAWRGLPEVCPADVVQRLDVLLTDAVCLSSPNASIVLLLSPLALCEHTWRENQHYDFFA